MKVNGKSDAEKYEYPVGILANADFCVCCGAVIPEGRMICPICEGEDNMSEAKDERMIDRETYRTIKKMNRAELQGFLAQYADHMLEAKEVKTVDLTALEEELRGINGIGGKRIEEIMGVIRRFLDIKE